MDGNEQIEEQSAITDPSKRHRQKVHRTADEVKQFWKAKKQEKKQRAKIAAAKRKTEAQQEWMALDPEAQAAIKAAATATYEARRLATEEAHQRSLARFASMDTPRIVFDLQFENVMNDRGKSSTVAQVKYSYSSLRRASFPLVPVIYSNDPESWMLSQLRQFQGFQKYPPQIEVGQLSSIHSNLVYLTADSDTVLWSIDPGTAFVIGAFVDHNVHKGLTLSRAQELGIRTARLPIQESVDAKNLCRVLTINHVVESIVAFCTNGGSWKDAFVTSLPRRRQDLQGNAETASASDNDEASDDDDNEG